MVDNTQPIDGGFVGETSVDNLPTRGASRGDYENYEESLQQAFPPQIADNEVEFLSYFITPDSLNVTGINRDVVLANIPSSEVSKVKNLFEALYMVENLEKSSKISLPGIKHFLLSMIAAYMNLSRGVNGLTAKLARTQRVETVSASWSARDLARAKKEASSNSIFSSLKRTFKF